MATASLPSQISFLNFFVFILLSCCHCLESATILSICKSPTALIIRLKKAKNHFKKGSLALF
jgi:hypothetical protein